MTKDEILEQVRTILHDAFDIGIEQITPAARLADDLDIDSIDAVDLIVRLKPLVGQRIAPEQFKSVRTVQDVVEAVHRIAVGTA